MGSDLLSNAFRGILAEYIVGIAVRAKTVTLADGIRDEWATHDLETGSGIKIEVKSSAYDQTWAQKRPSAPKFGIAPAEGWDNELGEPILEKRRWADVYVFCLLKKSESGRPDPLDMMQWEFYVLATSVLNDRVKNQKTIGLNSLKRLEPERVTFDGIVTAVERIVPEVAK